MEQANALQADFWNGGAGEEWRDRQEQMDAFMAGILDQLIAAAQPLAGKAVLDVGCGTGASLLALAAAGAHPTGVDISAPMLGLARSRLDAAGLREAATILADAQTHAFAPASFDAMVSRFGVMFFDDPVGAFRNIASALRPGAPLTFVTWAAAEANPWFGMPLAAAVSVLGPMDPVDPFAPGPMAFRDIPRVEGILRDAGLAGACGEEIGATLTPQGDLAAVSRAAREVGPAARMIRERGATEAQLAEIEAKVTESLRPYASGSMVRVPARLVLYRASAPG